MTYRLEGELPVPVNGPDWNSLAVSRSLIATSTCADRIEHHRREGCPENIIQVELRPEVRVERQPFSALSLRTLTVRTVGKRG